MVKIKCKNCWGIGSKTYPFGKNAKPRRSLEHSNNCKYKDFNINTIRKKKRD